jgi:hypothetical protein
VVGIPVQRSQVSAARLSAEPSGRWPFTTRPMYSRASRSWEVPTLPSPLLVALGQGAEMQALGPRPGAAAEHDERPAADARALLQEARGLPEALAVEDAVSENLLDVLQGGDEGIAGRDETRCGGGWERALRFPARRGCRRPFGPGERPVPLRLEVPSHRLRPLSVVVLQAVVLGRPSARTVGDPCPFDPRPPLEDVLGLSEPLSLEAFRAENLPDVAQGRGRRVLGVEQAEPGRRSGRALRLASQGRQEQKRNDECVTSRGPAPPRR